MADVKYLKFSFETHLGKTEECLYAEELGDVVDDLTDVLCSLAMLQIPSAKEKSKDKIIKIATSYCEDALNKLKTM